MLNKQYRLAEGVLFQKITNESVLFEQKTGVYFTLDELGTFIVEQLHQGLKPSEVSELIIKNYDTTMNEVKSDLIAFITDMQKNALIIEVD